ncbi:SWIM zinc finger family protein [Streptomyces sp. NPDC090023]|uniref:SWIM zinc finger family protein n=1 Tax=unclassified Streptomyces TaxID=2593676 RepID=UPI00380FC2E6
MTLTDHNPYRMRFTPSAPLPDDELYERAGGGRLWLDALAPRTKSGAKGPFGRASAYARTALVTHLVIEPGTIRCWINENTGPAPTSRAYRPQPHPMIHVPVLDHGQWRDLTAITRHLTDRLARLPAEQVLQEITSTGARSGIRILPALDQCQAFCSCSSRSALCKHAVTALLQVARCLDEMPLVLLLLRGRSPVDFFAGLQDPDHPSLHDHGARHLPSPPTTSAQSAHDRWERALQPLLPPVPALPEWPATPGLPAVAGLAEQSLAEVAADTARRAHSLLRTLTETVTPAAPTGMYEEANPGGGSPVSRQLSHIPLQQRLRELQEATGMTKAELAQAVRDWGVND